MMKTPAGSHPAMVTDFLLVQAITMHQISCPKKQRDMASHSCLSKQNQTFTAGEEIKRTNPCLQARPLFYLSLLVGEEIRLAQIPVYLLLKEKSVKPRADGMD